MSFDFGSSPANPADAKRDGVYSRRGSSRAVTTAALLTGLIGGVLFGCNYPASAQHAASGAQAAVVAASQPAVASSTAPLVTGLPDFTPLVERVGPSVVNIRVMEKVQRNPFAGRSSGDPMEELLRRFFGITIPDSGSRRRQQAPDSGMEERPAGVGSGFVLSADGYIMTNAHVVDDADALVVTLPDKREFRGKVVGKDKRTDVAVVKIDAKNLTPVKVGNVDNLKVGQWVVAIGSPFGLENSVTAGIVSAKQRDTGEYLPFIQTDVAINPGNSGGPLINMSGEVVGINSQIYSRSGGFMGISFSIPIDEAMRIADQLRATGSVTRGRIGVQIAPVDKEVAESLGLAAEQGALVRSVEANAPADKAGIQPGDIITKFNGKNIERTSDLPRLVGETKPGTTVSVTLLRNGSSKNVSVVIGKSLEEGQRAEAGDADKKAGAVANARSLGLEVADISAAQRKQLQVKGGVLVQDVAPRSRAEQAGLQEGDVIVSLGNQPVDSVSSFNAAVAKLPADKPATVLIQRGGMAHYGVIRPRP